MKKNKHFIIKLLVATFVFTGMLFMGSTYAKWLEKTQIKLSLKTDSFDIVYSGEKEYSAELVSEKSQKAEKLDINIEFLEDNKKALVHFNKGIPYNAFDEDKFIRIKYPIENKRRDYIAIIKEVEENFENQSEKVDFVADRLYLSFGGETYIYPAVDTEFNSNLTFDAYRFVERIDEQIYMNLVLRLSDESREKVKMFPKSIAIGMNEFKGFEKTDLKTNGDAVVVTYVAEFDSYLDQLAQEGKK